MSRKQSGVAGGLGALAVVLVLGASGCEPLAVLRRFDAAPEPPPASVLEGSELGLVATRFPSPPGELYTRGSRFLLRISFDPELVDLPRLAAVNLWAQDRSGGPWRQIETYPARREPAACVFEPEEDGAYGLRLSAVYSDGREALVPAPGDQPLVWLYVDRGAPKLSWLSPPAHAVLRPGESVELQWGASEIRFGEAPALLEWSGDGGASWSAITRVKSARGTGSVRWNPPVPATRRGAKPLVRITAWDLVGNRATAVLPLAALGAEAPAVVEVAAPADRPLEGSAGGKHRRPLGGNAAGAYPGAGAPATEDDGGEPRPAVLRRREEPAAVPGARAPIAKSAPEWPERIPRTAPVAGAEGSLAVKDLADGAVQPGGAPRPIMFSAKGPVLERALVDIEWRPGPDAAWEPVARGVPAREGKFLWRLPHITTDEGALRLTARESPGGEPLASAENPSPIRIDSDPPVAEVASVRLREDGAALVTLRCEDRGPAGIDLVELHVTRDSGATYHRIVVADPSLPVAVPEPGARIGFRVAARDRVGNATPAVAPGTPPQEVFEADAGVELAVESFEESTIRGGEQRYILWRFAGPPGLKALVEASRDAGSSWDLVAAPPAGAGKALWVAPAENTAVWIRVRVELPGGAVAEGRARPVRVDASPPQLAAGQIPARAAGEIEFPLAVTDPGGSGVDAVLAFTRPAAVQGGPSPWSSRPADRVLFDAAGGRVRISIADLPEGEHDLLLLASDRAGNGGRPTASTSPLARVAVDRTPVAIRVLPTALPWVEGLGTAVQVEIDLTDAVPPLWLEERTGEGWSEVLRWESLTPGEDLFRFSIPPGRERYEVRFGVRDAAGNVSYAVAGPRPVERAVRLDPLGPRPAEGKTLELKAGANQTVSWAVHPALAELAAELRAVVLHQPREGADCTFPPLPPRGGDCVQLYDDLNVSSACIWTLPAGDGEVHRILVRLLHRGSLVGEEASEPFRIVGGPAAPPRVEPQVVAVNENSRYYSERAELQLEKYRQSRSQHQKWVAEVTSGLRRDARGEIPPAELEKLSPDQRRQAAERERALAEAAEKIRENFTRALELDPRNYRAAYGMAQLLQRASPERGEETLRYLERTVEIKADHAPALNDLGASLILRSEYAQAEEPLRRAIAVEDLGPYRYNLALALFHQGKTAEARAHFEGALEKGGSTVKSGEVYYYIVSAFLQEGKTAEARRRLELYQKQIPPGLRESLAAALR